MIRQSISILAVLTLAACNSSSSTGTSPSALPAAGGGTTGGGTTGGGTTGGGTSGGSTGGGTTGGSTGGGPVGGSTSGSVFPIGDATSFAENGAGGYTLSSASTPINLVRTNSAASDQATYDLTIKGVTYNLTPKTGNRPGFGGNAFTAVNGGTKVSLFLNENAINATIANTQIKDSSGVKEYFSIVGTPALAANLPSSALYKGNGEISIDTGTTFDDAPNTTVTLNADFVAGTLSGQFDVIDEAGDGTGPIDIDGAATLLLSGTIQGNTFAADVDYTELQEITSGLNFVRPSTLNGGFFGPAGEEAVGIGINVGKSTNPNDVLIYTRIQATQQ